MSIPGLSTPRDPLDDYFQVGKAISARLADKALLPELMDVSDLLPLADAMDAPDDKRLARIAALVPRSPAAFVGFWRDVVLFTDEDGGHAPGQQWLVVLVVRNAGGANTAAGVMAEAGPLLLKVVKALSGWQPPIEGVGRLARDAAPSYSFGPGIGLFPLAFSAPLYIPGANP